uniref:Uncharacterized protein n=1 Tax=Sphaerodactylus townsendi TaxID=933632 RepID=A0ACB8F2P5_9SAUR
MLPSFVLHLPFWNCGTDFLGLTMILKSYSPETQIKFILWEENVNWSEGIIYGVHGKFQLNGEDFFEPVEYRSVGRHLAPPILKIETCRNTFPPSAAAGFS